MIISLVEAFNDYWRGAPKLDKIIYRVMIDPSARVLAIQAGEIQGMEYPDPTSLNLVRADDNLQLLTKEGMTVGYLAMNNGYGYNDSNKNGVHDQNEPWVKTPGYFEPFTHKSVRQAINCAINKTSIVKNIYKDTAIVAINGMPPFMLGWNASVVDYSYDPDLARELLAEAGYANGFNTTLWVMKSSRPYMVDPPKVGRGNSKLSSCCKYYCKYCSARLDYIS